VCALQKGGLVQVLWITQLTHQTPFLLHIKVICLFNLFSSLDKMLHI